MISPNHPLFKEYQMAVVGGDWDGLRKLQGRADYQGRRAVVERWMDFIKTANPPLWFKHIHAHACANFGDSILQ